jgi:hypothetical protein
VGLQDTGWLETYYYPAFYDPGDANIAGEATTDPQGLLTSEHCLLQVKEGRLKYTLEATIKAKRSACRRPRQLHANPPSAFPRADTWVGRAETNLGFRCPGGRWEKQPAAVFLR